MPTGEQDSSLERGGCSFPDPMPHPTMQTMQTPPCPPSLGHLHWGPETVGRGGLEDKVSISVSIDGCWFFTEWRGLQEDHAGHCSGWWSWRMCDTEVMSRGSGVRKSEFGVPSHVVSVQFSSYHLLLLQIACNSRMRLSWWEWDDPRTHREKALSSDWTWLAFIWFFVESYPLPMYFKSFLLCDIEDPEVWMPPALLGRRKPSYSKSFCCSFLLHCEAWQVEVSLLLHAESQNGWPRV